MNDEAQDLRAELDALEAEVKAIVGKRLPQAFGVDKPLSRLLRILKAMEARLAELEAQVGHD